MPAYAKDTELKRKLRKWFETNPEPKQIGNITYYFANYKYENVRVSIYSLVREGFLKSRKKENRNYEFYLNKENTYSRLVKQFLYSPPPGDNHVRQNTKSIS